MSAIKRDGETLDMPDCSTEIDRGLFTWWKKHPAEAREIAKRVVEFAVGDTYLDEVGFESNGIFVRVLVLCDVSKSEPELELVVERLRVVFGAKVDLWCCGTVRHFRR